MKILKHGELNPRQFICERCRCEFVADKSEYSEDNIYTTTPVYTITCPCCNYEMRVVHNKALIHEEECQDTFYELIDKLDQYLYSYIEPNDRNAYRKVHSMIYDLIDWRRQNESNINN